MFRQSPSTRERGSRRFRDAGESIVASPHHRRVRYNRRPQQHGHEDECTAGVPKSIASFHGGSQTHSAGQWSRRCFHQLRNTRLGNHLPRLRSDRPDDRTWRIVNIVRCFKASSRGRADGDRRGVAPRLRRRPQVFALCVGLRPRTGAAASPPPLCVGLRPRTGALALCVGLSTPHGRAVRGSLDPARAALSETWRSWGTARSETCTERESVTKNPVRVAKQLGNCHGKLSSGHDECAIVGNVEHGSRVSTSRNSAGTPGDSQ